AQELEAAELRAALLLFAKVTPPTGAMLEFARKALDLGRDELAERFRVDSERVRQWEEAAAGDPIAALALERLVRERLGPMPAFTGIALHASSEQEPTDGNT